MFLAKYQTMTARNVHNNKGKDGKVFHVKIIKNNFWDILVFNPNNFNNKQKVFQKYKIKFDRKI